MTTQPATFSYDVFLSYARPDRAWVDQELLAPLEAAGLRVCIDYRDFAPAAAILDEIERAIRSSRKTLFIFSPAYRQSEWSQLEQWVLQTLDPANRRGRFLVILQAPCELPERLKPFIYLDFTDPAQRPDERARLFEFLEVQPPPAEAVLPEAAQPPPTSPHRHAPTPTRGNPFTPGPAVHPDKFVGRKAELQAMLSRLETMGSIALVGEARIGKSSLLRYLEARLPGLLRDVGDYRMVYLSLNGVERKADFCRMVIRQLWPHIPPGIEPEHTLRAMERQTAPTMHDLETCLQWTSRSGLRIVLLLDEFKSLLDKVDEFDETFRGRLRSFYDDPYLKVTFVFATRQLMTEIENLNAYFVNGVTTQHLDRMSTNEAEELLRLPHDHPFTAEEVRIGLDVGDDHPLRLQWAGFLLYGSKRRPPGLLHAEDGTLHDSARRILGREVQAKYDLAMRLSNAVRERPPAAGKSSPAPLNHAITKLAEVIDSIGGRIATVLLLLGLVALLLYAFGFLSSEQLLEWQQLLSGGA